MEEKIERPAKKPKTNKKTPTEVEEKDDDEDDEDDEEEDPEEDDIPLSDIEGDAEDLEDVVPHTKLTINNKAALLASLNRIRLDTSSAVPFATHQSVVSSKPTAESVPDVQDDLQRELAILAQALEGARKGRALLLKEGVPFSRPSDYFAEMAKDDGQMQKIKDKLIEEASNKKAAAEARKLRDLKKFGKQVQVAKLQERQKAKKDTLEKIKTLKRSKSFNPPRRVMSRIVCDRTANRSHLQNAKKAPATSTPTSATSSTSPSTTSSRATATPRRAAPAAAAAAAASTPSGKRRTKSTVSAARSATPSRATP